MRLAVFRDRYWLQTELVAFARALGISRRGNKPELTARIERRLGGSVEESVPPRPKPAATRDSETPLSRDRTVVRYYSDAATRAFFEREIGPHFHFTYYLNQYRLSHPGLTYGDLVDEWLAEQARRSSGDYQAPIAEHGRYNRFIRDFFADPKNRGKSLRDAAAAWNANRDLPGGAGYKAGYQAQPDRRKEAGVRPEKRRNIR